MSKDKNKKKESAFWRGYDALVNALAFISGLALLGISIVIVLDVIMRYAFNKPFSITMPTAELILVLVLTFGGVYLLRDQGFIRVDIIVQFLPKKIQNILLVITDTLSAVVFFIVGIGAAQKCWELYTTGAIIINSGGNWKHWVYMAPVVLLMFIMPVQFLRNAIDVITGKRDDLGEHIEDEFLEESVADNADSDNEGR